jgi:tetratricopeptide (TPR) repeat protein
VRVAVFCAIVLCAALPSIALAQPYPGITPIPRTTDPATLHAIANRREILERIRIGVRDEMGSRWGDAASEFERVIALSPAEPQASTAYYDLGIARAGLSDYATAATAFEGAIARDPGFLAARANLVTVDLLGGDLAGARTAADAFVAAAPDSARALYARGIVALRAGDAATALRDFQALSSNDPAYAVAHYDIAIAEQQLGRFDDAERELRSAIALSPGYTRARIGLGAVLLHEGKKDEARVAFDAAAQSTRDATLRNLATSLRDAIEASAK